MQSFKNHVLSIKKLCKIYDNGFCALDNINVQINKGEIFALLGPNGAGKTTLINIICGLVRPSAGSIKILNYDHIKDYKVARSHIGLVPQELTTDTFETVLNTVKFSRGIFGKAPSLDCITTILQKLSLWDKRYSQIHTLSGGMKKRVLIAKALSHEPDILFLDEPSSGVDVELRQSMWQQIQNLRDSGVSIILTTHYIAEAEEIADRIGIINQGKLILVENKKSLMQKLEQKKLVIHLHQAMTNKQLSLLNFKNLHLEGYGKQLVFTYDKQQEAENQIFELFVQLKHHHIKCQDINTYKSSLEEIFMQLVNKK